MKEKVLLSTAYLGPIQYYSKLLRYKDVYVEINDNFVKQTYRNRCKIYGANGIVQLSIPVKKSAPKTKVKDLQIDYATNWQKIHWKSIESAYRSSPFFEFYADYFIPFYKTRYHYLIEFNSLLQELVLENLGINKLVKYTQEYSTVEIADTDDFRELIHPKRNTQDNDFIGLRYNQVFIEKYGFKNNLSIIDLIFNEGPNAINILNSH